MKWTAMFGSFLLHAVIGMIGVAGVLLSLPQTEGSGILVVFGAPVGGLVYGLVGIPSGYYFYKEQYHTAAAISIFCGIVMGVALVDMF